MEDMSSSQEAKNHQNHRMEDDSHERHELRTHPNFMETMKILQE